MGWRRRWNQRCKKVRIRDCVQGEDTNQVSVMPKPADISTVRSPHPGSRTALRASQKALTVEVTTASPPLLILLRELRLKEPFN